MFSEKSIGLIVLMVVVVFGGIWYFNSQGNESIGDGELGLLLAPNKVVVEVSNNEINDVVNRLNIQYGKIIDTVEAYDDLIGSSTERHDIKTDDFIGRLDGFQSQFEGLFQSTLYLEGRDFSAVSICLYLHGGQI